MAIFLMLQGLIAPVEVDLADKSAMHITVDREEGQYLGHPSSVLLADGKTVLCVYPKGHGRGALILKRSEDGGVHGVTDSMCPLHGHPRRKHLTFTKCLMQQAIAD
ncbi:MAG: hypothetical protein MK100_08120 [Phycisphaerales bacterium]|nr:hypothetical protein [Phycisphaerales bacterium]